VRNQAAQLAGTMVVLIPAFGPDISVDFGVSNSGKDGQAEVRGFSGAKEGLYAVLATFEGEGENFLELLLVLVRVVGEGAEG